MQSERVKPTADVRAKAADLIKGLSGDDAKLRAIYKYVSTQFRYIGIDFGIGRYQPHFAGEVLTNQYGDCKDKHTLFASLLASAGIASYPALVSSMRGVDADLPFPAQFDHVITLALPSGRQVWLDTTPEVSPFGYLFSSLRGKPALAIPLDKAAGLTPAPSGPGVTSSETFRVDAKVSDKGILTGKAVHTIQGNDTEVLLRAAFRSMPLMKWKDLV